MGLDLTYTAGETSLEDDEKDGLLIKAVATRGDLDEFEQNNIQKAMLWLHARRLKKEDILTEKFIRSLHKRMFGEVWQWAGDLRNSNKNIGVDKYTISIELRTLLDDCVYWINEASYQPDELAIRFKHRLVSIHCFANGNGRHSRLIADIIIEKMFSRPVFSWGANDTLGKADIRKKYLTALRAADRNNYDGLIAFARS